MTFGAILAKGLSFIGHGLVVVGAAAVKAISALTFKEVVVLAAGTVAVVTASVEIYKAVKKRREYAKDSSKRMPVSNIVKDKKDMNSTDKEINEAIKLEANIDCGADGRRKANKVTKETKKRLKQFSKLKKYGVRLEDMPLHSDVVAEERQRELDKYQRREIERANNRFNTRYEFKSDEEIEKEPLTLFNVLRKQEIERRKRA